MRAERALYTRMRVTRSVTRIRVERASVRAYGVRASPPPFRGGWRGEYGVREYASERPSALRTLRRRVRKAGGVGYFYGARARALATLAKCLCMCA